MFQAAVARTTITPPLGLPMMGYAGRDGVAEEVESDLLATLVVLEDADTRIGLLGVDLGILGGELFPAVRAALASALGTAPQNILTNTSHTHCGPTLNAYYYDYDPELARMRNEYEAELVRKVAALGAIAAKNLQPARMGTAAGEARIGVNRREVDEDGSVFLGEVPDGVIDHEVRVLRIDDLEGRPIAVVFAHGCHTVTMGPKGLAYSSDYVGPARKVIEENLGCPSLFLQANAGDINPKTGIGSGDGDLDNKNRLGWILGGEVVKVCGDIFTHSVRGPRVFFGMLSKAAMYPRVALPKEPNLAIRVREETLELPLYPFPPPAAAEDLERTARAEVDRVMREGVTGAPRNVGIRLHLWTQSLLRAIREGRPATATGVLQAIAIGDFAIASFPGETFAIAGLEVKRRSPFPDTLFLGYSNGAVSYIPTREAYPAEGWSPYKRYGIPDMHFKDYGIPMALLPGCSETVVDRAVASLEALWAGR